MAHSAMQGVRGCSGIEALVWSRVPRGDWVRCEGGKGYPTIFVITNLIVVAVEPGISNDLIISQYFA